MAAHMGHAHLTRTCAGVRLRLRLDARPAECAAVYLWMRARDTVQCAPGCGSAHCGAYGTRTGSQYPLHAMLRLGRVRPGPTVS